MHGKQSDAEISADSLLLRNLPDKIKVGRYHSLAVTQDSLPQELRVTARTDDGEVMAVEHKDHPTFGVQFHPESIYTEHGKRMIETFVNSDY